MPVTDWKPAGSGVNASDVGDVAWSDPGNITASNDAWASASMPIASPTSQILRATTFGFTVTDIPDGSTIDGIEVGVERQQGSAGNNRVRDLLVRLRTGTGQTGDDKADTGTNWPNSDGEVIYGSDVDTWNSGITDADIRTTDFGLDLRAQRNTGTAVANVDHIRIRVHFTEPASEPVDGTASPTVSGLLDAVGAVAVEAGASPSGSSTLVATASLIIDAGTSLAGVGSLGAEGSLDIDGGALLSSSGQLTGAGEALVDGAATLSSFGQLESDGVLDFEADARLGSSGALSGTGEILLDGSVGLSGFGQLDATGAMDIDGTGAFTGTGRIEADGSDAVDGTVTLTATGSMSLGASVIVDGSAQYVGIGALSADGLMDIDGEARLSVSGSLSAQGSMIFNAFGSLRGFGILRGTPDNGGEQSARRARPRTISPQYALIEGP